MTFEIYSSGGSLVDLRWRWRLKAANGEIVADSAEGYVSKYDCEYAIRLVQGTSAATPVIEAMH
jgi:uncharacterized protein YegP (UPF0339 family)